MSSQHVTLHDLDLDRENHQIGGSISLTSGHTWCTDSPTLSCDNVPFSKGTYISKIQAVGSEAAEINALALQVAGVGAEFTNWLGITDSYFRKVGEHNMRVQGWYRLNIMRSHWYGEHYSPGKAKVTPRVGVDGHINVGDWKNDPRLPDTWDDDIEGRTRADLLVGEGDGSDDNADDYVHQSRYLVISGNVFGSEEPIPENSTVGSIRVNLGTLSGDEELNSNMVFSNNTFYDQPDQSGADISAPGYNIICVDNTYSSSSTNCTPSSPPEERNVLINPEPLTYPEAPVR